MIFEIYIFINLNIFRDRIVIVMLIEIKNMMNFYLLKIYVEKNDITIFFSVEY